MASTLYSSNEVAASDSHANDRNNLLLLTRLVLRGLLEHCMQANNRMLAADTPQLQHLFIMVEKVLRHGFKYAAQRTLITLKTPEMELWNLIERIGRTSKEIEESVSCVQQLPHISSPICRVRAWLRLAVMQKKLSDYFQALVENKLLLRECYEDWALLRHETTGVVMAGSLIGLSVIDCNLFLREDDLSRQALSVDLNMYIKIPTVLIDSEDDEEDEENAKKKSMDRLAKEAADELKNILDQKNYLEELNRQLAANVTNLKLRLARYEVGLGSKSASVSEVVDEDLMDEKDVPLTTAPLSKLSEMTTAMELMEKSVHEKQDVIVSLHQQIDDVKRINIDLYQKLRTSEETRKQLERTLEKAQQQFEQEKAVWSTTATTAEGRQLELNGKMKKVLDSNNNLQQELRKKTERCSELQNELAAVQVQLRTLQETLDNERAIKGELQERVDSLEETEKSHSELKKHYEAASGKIREYETALEELGGHLSESKLKVEDLKEGFMPLAEAQWTSDKEADTCKNCETKFSVSKRKHHCRHCGGIFCNSCSENTMPLPSSAKPVRVCNPCCQMLLQRFSARPET